MDLQRVMGKKACKVLDETNEHLSRQTLDNAQRLSIHAERLLGHMKTHGMADWTSPRCNIWTELESRDTDDRCPVLMILVPHMVNGTL